MPQHHDYDDVIAIDIEAPDAEPEVLAEIEVERLDDRDWDDVEMGTRLITLSRGGHERDDKSLPTEVQSNEEEDLQVTITPDPNRAIGTFLHLLEQHGLDEAGAMDGLRDPALNLDLDTYEEWRDTRTQSDREEMLLADGESRRARSPHVDHYLDHGSFRTVAHHDVAERVGQKLYDGLNPNPRRCYRNAVVALNAAKDSDHLQYVEGLALPKQGGRAVAHAWVEIHDVVVDLTWPWHAPLPPNSAVYYGVPIDTDEVLETTRRRNAGFNPILLDDEDLFTR